MCQTKRLSAALLLLAASCAARADFNDGVVAFMTGKFETALQVFVPLAESSNHAYAQYFLARMYETGQGVTEDMKIAAKWYRKAAQQGIGDAQLHLAMMYEHGQGVPKDFEYAYGWYSVAAHLGNTKAPPALERVKAQLGEQELLEADKLSRDLIAQYGVTPASTARSQ